jgi:hypothetical protein
MDPISIALLLSGLGAGIGGIASGISASKSKGGGNFFTGTPGHSEQFQQLTPEQQKLQGATIQQALAALQNINKPGANTQGFQPIENYARKQFYSDTIPSLAERFTAMGGGQRSSAFQGALGQAGAGLESQLGAMRSQYGQQQQGLDTSRIAALLSGGMGKSFENAYFPRQEGFLGSLGQSVASTIPSYLSQYAQQDQNQKLTDILSKLSNR